MAQTKTSTRRSSSNSSTKRRSSSNSSSSTANRPRAKASASSRSRSRNGRSTQARSPNTRSASRSANRRNASQSAKSTVSSGAEEATGRVSTALRTVKTPLIAGGAALMGLAGAAVVNARSNRRRKVLGVSLPKTNGLKLPRGGLDLDAQKITSAVTDAAKRADQIGQRVSSVANSVQKVSETAGKAAKKA